MKLAICIDCKKPKKSTRRPRCMSCGVKRSRTADVVARGAATLRARLGSDPDLRERYCGRLNAARTGDLNRYRLVRLRAGKNPDWLPLEYRPLWRELRQLGVTDTAERERMVRDQIAKDDAVYRRTGQLPCTAGQASVCGRAGSQSDAASAVPSSNESAADVY